VLVAIVMAAGSVAVVGLLLWLANSHLRGFEDSIVTN